MKSFFQMFTTAWIGIATHKLRSFLTIMGIVIGVAAVISLMSVGKGAQASILSRIQSLGANLITISPGFVSSGGVRGGFGGAQSLTLEDAQAIAQQVPYIDLVAPSYSANMQLVAGSSNLNSRVTGVTPEYQGVYNLKTDVGSFFSESDYEEGARVVVLGSTVKTTLFADNDPVDQKMRLGNNIVRVVGVLQSKGNMPGSTDDAVMIPFTAMQQMVAQQKTSTGGHRVSSIALTITDVNKTEEIIAEITSLLRTQHRLSDTASDDFRIMSTQEMAETVTETTGTMTLLLGAIAAISLLVGGIGVMNIMLVSVLERTREIGIRKALGAKERDIWGQFLVEAAFLTFSGGIIGVTVGWGASYLMAHFATMNTLVTLDIVVMAVSVSVGIGLFFGFYPAWNAARLNPIEALRSE